MFSGYTIVNAQKTVRHAVQSVQAGTVSVEQAIASAVAQTILEFQGILAKVESCCDCGHSMYNKELLETAAKIQEQYQQVTV